MDYLWTPWRYRYVTGGASQQSCVFCGLLDSGFSDRDALIVHRAESNFVVLNRYPYTSGHLMVVPYGHVSSLGDAAEATAREMMDLVQLAERVLRSLYRPEGINLGMNIGRAAGAGVAEHIHMHVLPRWAGDSSFTTVVGETRVLPEALETAWERVRQAFAQSDG